MIAGTILWTKTWRDWTLRGYEDYSTLHCPSGHEISPCMVGCPWCWKRTPKALLREDRWRRDCHQRNKDRGMKFPACVCGRGAEDEHGCCTACGGLIQSPAWAS